ncbi:MAG TPA: DUF1127 domain-containing protein [Hyphomicrobiaceae bacterium]|nr:DUF1127 domain-containing protein [Hyphomicrobiaceae bacterium]
MLRSFAPQSPGDIWPYADPTPAAGPARRLAALLGWLASAILASLAAIAEIRTRARAERDLADLDDRMLRDIGITRTEIGRVVRYGRRG